MTTKPKRPPRRFKSVEAINKAIDKANLAITKFKQQIQTCEDAKELLSPETMFKERNDIEKQIEPLWEKVARRERRLKRLQNTLAMFQTEVIPGMGEISEPPRKMLSMRDMTWLLPRRAASRESASRASI